MIIALIVIVVLVALVGFVIVGFNKLRTSDIGAQEALGGIDVQLTRRAELIPNLVETVKGYAAHESGVFEEVTKARAGVVAAAAGDDVPAKAAADAALQQALVRVNAVAEAYPDLKANQNFLELQSQLAETENQIAFARQYYNDAVASLNKLVMTIPWMLFTGIANVHKREFYDAPEGQQVAPQVSFDTPAPAAPLLRPRPPLLRPGRSCCPGRSAGRPRCAAGASGRLRRPVAPRRRPPAASHPPGQIHRVPGEIAAPKDQSSGPAVSRSWSGRREPGDSSSVSWSAAAAVFSSRCATLDVPGIGSITGESCSSQASATWDVRGVVGRGDLLQGAVVDVVGHRAPRDEADALRGAVVEQRLGGAVAEVEPVLDRHDRATACAAVSSSTDTSDRPMWRILPSSCRALSSPTWSSAGKSGSMRCSWKRSIRSTPSRRRLSSACWRRYAGLPEPGPLAGPCRVSPALVAITRSSA